MSEHAVERSVSRLSIVRLAKAALLQAAWLAAAAQAGTAGGRPLPDAAIPAGVTGERPLLAAAAGGPAAGEEARSPRVRTFEFRYETALREIPETARLAYLWIPYPPETEDQSVRGLDIASPMPYEVVVEPRHGNRALRFSAAPGAPAQPVTLRFLVTRRERVRRPDGPATNAPPSDPARVRPWLEADRRVPINGKIRAWALETVAGRATDLDRARAIYDHVVSSLRYDKSGQGWGRGDIYWACDARRGNCTDFHAVFIGYARAVGIPAKFEMGFPLPPERGAGEIAGYHCWAQFFLEGRGWVPVDASEANKEPGRREYFFGAHDENRVLLSVGRDLVFPGMKGEPLNFFVYPYAEVDGVEHAQVERRFSYRDVEPSAPGSP